MYRHKILFNTAPVAIRLHTPQAIVEPPAPVAIPRTIPEPVAATFPNELGQKVVAAPPPSPDLTPLLTAISSQLTILDERRRQSLSELQQVALELAISVASHLVHQAISNDQFAVEKLVQQAISTLGINAAPTISLHPLDLELLHKRLLHEPVPWSPDQVTIRSDPGVNRGGCRIETESGRMRVSEMSLRLSEIRRHWMEELDDSEIERRRPAGEGSTLRRFPDRRESA